MKRIQLFEFEDFAWLPKTIRIGVTNLIVVLHRILGTHEVLVDLIQDARTKIDFEQIVDLGSGSGGAMPEVLQQINIHQPVSSLRLLLTDLYPNPEAIATIESQDLADLSYKKEAVDATNFANTPKGLKTMVNSFHHMPPDTAKQILQSARENKQPILIYEMGENFVPTLLWWLLLPLSLLILIVMSLCMTPFVKPLSLKQVLFTYIIPVIPLVYAWDGQASTMRTYTFDDVKMLIGEAKEDNYKWEIAKAKKRNGKNLGYYVLGYPTI